MEAIPVPRDNATGTSEASIVTKSPNKKLVILDINGLFCRKIDKKDKETPKPHWKTFNHYYIELRPKAEETLINLFAVYRVAFYSSTTEPNASRILNYVLSSDLRRALEFTWYRDQTDWDPNTGKGHATVKRLDRVFSNPIANEFREWNESNTIIVDDSPEKHRFNKPKNVLIIPAFIGNPDDDELESLLAKISTKFAECEITEGTTMV